MKELQPFQPEQEAAELPFGALGAIAMPQSEIDSGPWTDN